MENIKIYSVQQNSLLVPSPCISVFLSFQPNVR